MRDKSGHLRLLNWLAASRASENLRSEIVDDAIAAHEQDTGRTMDPNIKSVVKSQWQPLHPSAAPNLDQELRPEQDALALQVMKNPALREKAVEAAVQSSIDEMFYLDQSAQFLGDVVEDILHPGKDAFYTAEDRWPTA